MPAELSKNRSIRRCIEPALAYVENTRTWSVASGFASTLPPARRARCQRRRAILALGKVLANPEATDQVLVFSTYANAGSMHRRIDRFFDNPAGMRLYREQRAIDSHTVDLDALSALS